MAEPSLEVVVPFYGDPAYLKQTVESLRGQSDSDWHALVIDDCYPDPGAASWVADLGDPRIEVIRHRENHGVRRTFQEAIDQARADYLVILGCDDRLRPGYVDRMKHLARRTRASVIQPGVQVIDETGRPCAPLADRVKRLVRPTPGAVYQGENVTTSLLHGNWTYFPSLCWRRAEIESIALRPYEVVPDLGLLVDLLLAGGTLAVDTEVTFEYRRHAASVSSRQAQDGRRFEEEVGFTTAIAAELASHGWPRAARAARWRLTMRAHMATRALGALRGGDFVAARDLSHRVFA